MVFQLVTAETLNSFPSEAALSPMKPVPPAAPTADSYVTKRAHFRLSHDSSSNTYGQPDTPPGYKYFQAQ